MCGFFHSNPWAPEQVSERASKWAQRSARAKRAVRSKRMSERCERTSERRSEWPSALRVEFIVILPTVRGGMAKQFLLDSSRSFVWVIYHRVLIRSRQARHRSEMTSIPLAKKKPVQKWGLLCPRNKNAPELVRRDPVYNLCMASRILD